MEVVSEGSLESISRPASGSKRSGSRSSTVSVLRSISQLQGSLDILPPEDPSSWTKPEIEEDVVVTDFTDDLDEVESLVSTIDGTALELESDYGDTQTESNKSDVVSEGVLAVCAEEPKTEQPNVEQENETSSTYDNKDSDDIDPKIRKGLEKIKKLDTILSEKVKKEKEVKRQRLEQERMWREHIESLERTRDVQLGKQVDLGPAHVLALGAPEDTDDSLYEESPPVTPLFATQPIVDDVVLERRHLQEKLESSAERHRTSVDSKGRTSNASERSNESSQHGEKTEPHLKGSSRRNKKDTKDRKGKKKDFIKRNIMLAADANNAVAMTEEEKKRLDELLSDMNNLVDEPFATDSASLTLYTDGFQPSQEEANQLADIDFQLQSLLPSEEYEGYLLCNTPINEQDMPSQMRSPRSEASNELLDEEGHAYGELVLHETKDMRDMKLRLLAIEEQLNRFQNLDNDDGVLSESLLRQLLDGDSRTTSEATTIFDRVSSNSTSMSYDTTSSFEKSSFALESLAPSPAIPTAEQ